MIIFAKRRHSEVESYAYQIILDGIRARVSHRVILETTGINNINWFPDDQRS